MARKYRFDCPACGERIVVDRHVRDELLDRGCVVCASTVRPDCFEAV